MSTAAALREALDRHLSGVTTSGAWEALRASGVLGLSVPEELGGAGLRARDAEPVLTVLGSHALTTSYLESAVVAAHLLQAERTTSGDQVLRDIAAGAVIAVAGLDPRLRPSVSATPNGDGWRLDGDAPLVLDGAIADHLLIVARTEWHSTALLLAPRAGEGLTLQHYPTIDGRLAADLRFINVDALLIASDVDEALTEAGDIALACLAIEAAALMERLVADTLAYAKTRYQFGQPIAMFQALQHRLVDMHIQARRSAAIAKRAMASLDGHWAERARVVSAAKATIADAGRFVGQNAVQLHGGMGMTDELPIGRMFKRLTMIEHELGSADQHRLRFGRMAAQQQAA